MKLGLDKAEDADIIEAITGRLHYQPMILGVDDDGNEVEIPNPENTLDFTQRKIFEYVKNEMQAWFGDKVREVARPIEKIEVDKKLNSMVIAVV